MRIFMLCDFYNESLEYQENLLVKYYRKHGHEVTVVASTFESVFDYYNDRHDSALPMRDYEDQGARVIKLPYRFNVLNRLRAYMRIDALLNEARPDLIFVHDIMLNLPDCVRYVERHPACKMILDYHADYSNSGKNALSLKILHGVIRRRFLDHARPHLSRIFPIVPAGATFLHEVYKVPHHEMELLPLGADTDVAAEVRRRGDGRALRYSLGIGEDEIVIFTGGKLAPSKQIEVLFDAVARLPSRPLQVVVIGDAGPEHESYRRGLIKLAAGRANIHFVGWLGSLDVYRYLDMANLAVFPASQSILWQQAIAMGLPLIVGNTGHQDISYLNCHRNIVILSKEDIRGDRLADAIDGIVGNPSRMSQMREGAARVAADCLDWNKLILKTLDFKHAAASAMAGRKSAS